MGTLKNNGIAIILIYINVFFIFRVVEACYSIQHVNYGFIFMLLLIGTIIFMFYHSVLKRTLFKLFFTVIISILLVGTYFINGSFIKVITDNWLNVSLIEINNSIYESISTNFYQYKPILAIIIPLLVFIFISLALKAWNNSILFFNLGVMIFFWYSGYSEIIKLHLFKYLFITIWTYYCNVYTKHKRLLIKRGIKPPTKKGENIVYAFILIFFMCMIMVIMPQEGRGRLDSNIFTKWNNAYSKQPTTTTIAQKDSPEEKFKYDISLSGYDSGNKRLGGKVSIDYSLALKVKSDKPYYLKGAVKDFYDGYSWANTSTTYKKNKSTLEPAFKDEFFMEYADEANSITVYPEGVKTSTFFAPKNAYDIEFGNTGVFYNDIPTFLSNDSITKPYTVNFYKEKANIDVILENAGVHNEQANRYYEGSYKKYLQLPGILNTDIFEKVYSITKDCKNNFEKVEKIKEYLLKNYKYSLNVSEVPKDQEFLEYFLNVEKKGYCTYFATATTIFCRMAGIPARYVEGFNMTNEKDSKGLFIVTNQSAHAWTEVLLIGSTGIGTWQTLDSVPNAAEEIEKIKKSEQGDVTVGKDDEGSLSQKSKANTKNNLKDIEPSGTNKKKLSKAYITSIILFSIILLLISIRHIMFAIKKVRIMKSKSIVPLYNYSLKRLEKVGIKKSNTDTDKEFANKIDGTHLKKTMNSMVLLCYEEFYGSKEIKGFDKVKYYEFIEKFIKGKQNIIKYYFIKYIF